MQMLYAALVLVLLQVRSKKWREARIKSDDVNAFIANCSGTQTLEDIRRCVPWLMNNDLLKWQTNVCGTVTACSCKTSCKIAVKL